MGFKYFNIDTKNYQKYQGSVEKCEKACLYRARYIYQLNEEELLIGPETGGLTKYNMKTVFYKLSPICENF